MKKTYIQTDEKFDEALQKLKEANPGFSGSLLIRIAVIQMALNNMQVGFVGIESNIGEGIQRRKKALPKEDWCKMFGGEMKEGVCSIYKYEVVSTGQVRKNVRAIAVSSFPPDVNEFKRSVLGHFESVEEAEEAYIEKPLA